MSKFILILFALFAIATPKALKQYRTDYVYNSKTDAFYKLHTVERSSWESEDICKQEGAELMMLSNPEDIAQVHGMFKPFTDLGPYLWIASDGQYHESAEEAPLITFPPVENYRNIEMFHSCNVLTRKGDIEGMVCYRGLPFVCKIEAKIAPYDSQCGTYGENYHYEPSVGSCYRISNIAYSWDEAYAECRAEGAHLIVINSKEEMEVIHRITQIEVRARRVHASFFFFAGFRAEEPVDNGPIVFKTIFNQTLEEAGFAEWCENEPNNATGSEYCGSIFKNNGKFNDVDCSHRYVFICEKEVETTSSV